jgi:DNA (cytosine-5)-methyltransferase 1
VNVLSLFSGIGAFDLGLSRAGMHTVALCESDPFCHRVLAKHWPRVPCYDDVRTLTAERLAADGISVDVICGGFPCQPHSVAGKRGASSDDRDLWPEFARLIREIRPRWVLAENVPGLRSSESGRYFGGILRDLAGAGYNAEWTSISAADVGAPHRRERVWIVAYPARLQPGRPQQRPERQRTGLGGEPVDVADATLGGPRRGRDGPDTLSLFGGAGDMAHATCEQPYRGRDGRPGWRPELTDRSGWLAQSGLGGEADGPSPGMDGPWGPGWEDGVPRVARGVPNRVSRLKALGNSLVPQIPEMLGRAIMERA